jgi:hypothetical protein
VILLGEHALCKYKRNSNFHSLNINIDRYISDLLQAVPESMVLCASIGNSFRMLNTLNTLNTDVANEYNEYCTISKSNFTLLALLQGEDT